MKHKSFLTSSMFLSLLLFNSFLQTMNREDEQSPVGFPRSDTNRFDKKTEDKATKKNAWSHNEEFVSAVQSTVLETLSKLHGDAEVEEKDSDKGFFRPIFDDEDPMRYKKLTRKLINSSVECAPERLRNIIKLYANPKSYKQLSKERFFKNKFLFYGPTGSGKTCLAKSFADYCNIPRQYIVSALLLTPQQPCGEQNIFRIFEPYLSRENKQPIVIIFDHIFCLTNNSALLNMLDRISMHNNIVFIAIADNIDKISPSFKKCFKGSMFELGHLDHNQRDYIFESFLNDDEDDDEKVDFKKEIVELKDSDQKLIFDIDYTDSDVELFARKSSGFSPRHLSEIGDDAKMIALEEYLDKDCNLTQFNIPVSRVHFLKAIQRIRVHKDKESSGNWTWFRKAFIECYKILLPVFGSFLQCEMNRRFYSAFNASMYTIPSNWLIFHNNNLFAKIYKKNI